MFIEINKKELFSKIDLEKNNIFDFENIRVEEVKKHIKELDIFEIKEDNKRLNSIRKIAFLILNPHYNETELDLTSSQLYTNNPEGLWALYLGSTSQINIETNEKSLNKIGIKNYKEIEKNTTAYTGFSFNWNSTEDFSKDTWNSQEFVLNAIEEATKKYSDFEEIIKFTPEYFWEDESFVERLKGYKTFLEKMPKHFYYYDSFFNVAKKDNDFSLMAFDKIYSNLIYNNFAKQSYLYDDHTSKINSLKYQPKTEEVLKEIEKEEQLHKKSKKVAIKVKEELLTNISLVQQLLKNEKFLSIYQFLSEDMKKEPVVLETIFQTTENSDKSYYSTDSYIPKEVFENENYVKRYIATCLKHERDLNNMPDFYSYWINDKSKLLEYAKLTKNKISSSSYRKTRLETANDPYLKIFDILPKHFRQDIEVMSMFIEKNPKIYPRLAEAVRNNKKTLIAYVSQSDLFDIEYKADKVPTEVLKSLNKEERKKVLSVIPELVRRDEETLTWLNDLELLPSLAKILDELELSDNLKKQLYSNDQACLDMMNINYKVYTVFPKSKKMNVKFAKIYAEEVYHDEMKKHIPKELYGSIEFCMYLLKKYSSYAKDLPKEIWNNRLFINELSKAVDNNEIKIEVFNEGPSRINEMIKTFKVKPGETQQFFNNYISKLMLSNDLTNKEVKKKSNKI